MSKLTDTMKKAVKEVQEMLHDERAEEAVVAKVKAELHPAMPERFNSGGGTAEERAAWIAANGG